MPRILACEYCTFYIQDLNTWVILHEGDQEDSIYRMDYCMRCFKERYFCDNHKDVYVPSRMEYSVPFLVQLPHDCVVCNRT